MNQILILTTPQQIRWERQQKIDSLRTLIELKIAESVAKQTSLDLSTAASTSSTVADS